eukprot:TRINITY_DN4552_c0_g1::TRINITY_DN4552_c0_g1_i1::g.23257::m.23257 TRINITY_DN4552_c0_g1::TRINITY_DN4552_c0_g1_i1::g.23257  ORF type:complete len:269 (+),score=62.82,sp/O82531/PSB1_PETHY/56.11/1e-81,Proteasome/PF00227.21/2.8e-38 TRINITY_DN4552_c0_g1_i1:65-808(+)
MATLHGMPLRSDPLPPNYLNHPGSVVPEKQRGHSHWSPYVSNGGTVLALAGEDYAIVAADTRMSIGYSIISRQASKITKLTNNCVMASSGMQADAVTLGKVLNMRLVQYKYEHKKDMSIDAIGRMLANTLYYRRFFPYYTFNVLGGLDSEGKGVVYSYDAVGCVERVKYNCTGTSESLIQPLLDSQVERTNQVNPDRTPLSLDEAIILVKDAFTSAGERDIYTGDSVEIYIVTKEGTRMELFELKKD